MGTEAGGETIQRATNLVLHTGQLPQVLVPQLCAIRKKAEDGVGIKASDFG